MKIIKAIWALFVLAAIICFVIGAMSNLFTTGHLLGEPIVHERIIVEDLTEADKEEIDGN